MKSIQVPATALIIAASIGGCKNKPKEEAKVEPVQPVATQAAAVTPASASAKADPIADSVAAAKTLSEAFEAASSTFGEIMSKSSRGALLMVGWAQNNLSLDDVRVAKNETTFEKIKKDPDEERKKRMCITGDIVHITVKKDEHGKYTTGYLGGGGLRAIHFLAVGSTGDLVEGKAGRFCGAVTGRYSYLNSDGGTTHGIELVGMFDIPENRAKKPAATAAPAAKPAPASDVVKLDDLPDAK